MIHLYKAIVFDWDGTLADTCDLILSAHNHVRAHMGQELWTMDDFFGRPSQSAREYYPQIYGGRADEAQKILYDYVEENHLKLLKPMDHAKEVLMGLNSLLIDTAVVSNKRHDTLHKEVNALQWGDHFASIIGAGVAEKDKPAADPLLMALAEINSSYEPADILYIGDTETDLLCAKNAGCPVAYIQTGAMRPELIDKYKPLYVWNDLSPLWEVIRSQVTDLAVNKA